MNVKMNCLDSAPYWREFQLNPGAKGMSDTAKDKNLGGGASNERTGYLGKTCRTRHLDSVIVATCKLAYNASLGHSIRHTCSYSKRHLVHITKILAIMSQPRLVLWMAGLS